MSFRFLDYSFDNGLATFRYQSENDIFTEKVQFVTDNLIDYNKNVLDKALFLAFVVLGTSYYKVRAGKSVELPRAISTRQAEIFNRIYQEGMSQFAFENKLTRNDLAEFVGGDAGDFAEETFTRGGSLVTLSGGKDSLLATEMTIGSGTEYKIAYITASESYPDIINEFGEPVIIRRMIDKEGLKNAGGFNGHVPVTIINQALMLIQAILLGYSRIEFGIGKEGLEAHAFIDDLPVNHQWAKTADAQSLMDEYIKNFVTPSIKIDSLLKDLSELEIARSFAGRCWQKYGDRFSSCNVANYKQGANNATLKWCGKCAKCANSYLLFAPFVPYTEQLKIFGHDLFTDPEMTETFKGLLGVDGVMKPFECIASIDELRYAYKNKLPGYGDLPFEIN
ncbi:hypothetical protein IKW73_03760 [Candidatus Saccharibacteria bacterium]|nr:hypothetical protein [Candidatus Saccharibacteria bacterium]